MQGVIHLDGDGLGGTHGFAELAGDTSFLPTGITTQQMLASETSAQWALFKRIIDGNFRLKSYFQCQP